MTARAEEETVGREGNVEEAPRRVRFLWDFFGPNAEDTARHFEVHLVEFLDREKLRMPTGVLQETKGHFSVFCDPPDLPLALLGADAEVDASGSGESALPVAERIGRALRPRRVFALDT